MMWWFGQGGEWMWAGMLFMVIFWVAVVALIIWAVRRFSGHMPMGMTSGGGSASALDIAKERYAKGEISKEQFAQLKKDLS